MMCQQTIEKLRPMRLRGTAGAYQQQLENAGVARLTFDERLAMLVDGHATWLENEPLARRLKTPRLDAEPCAEDVNYRHARQLDGAQFRVLLLQSQCVAQHQSVLLTGPRGSAKAGWRRHWRTRLAGLAIECSAARPESCSATCNGLRPTAA
jgi:hypothetical protein